MSTTRFNPSTLLAVLSLCILCAIALAVTSGAVSVPPSAIIHLLFNIPADSLSDGLSDSFYDDQYSTIILDIRLPRVLLAGLVGALLAASGAIMQGLFRNPLADPSLIGVTAGASMGASVVIVLMTAYSSHWLGLSLLSLGAFVGGLLTTWLVYRLANKGVNGTSVTTMLLAGIGITALAGSVTSLLEFYADNEMLRRMSLWRMGGLDGANYSKVLLIGLSGALFFIVLPRYSQALNALLLGESEARYLGVDTESLKKRMILVVTFSVGICVALSGTISFVGLVVPHIMRLLIGPDHRFLLPASALGGALLLIVSDNIARTVLAPTELPVGLISAFIGVPFFISLLKRRYIYGLS